MSLETLKPLKIEHKDIFNAFFREDPPDASELTFTNLFVWRHRYRPTWTRRYGCLLIVLHPEGQSAFGLQPVGAGDKPAALEALMELLEEPLAARTVQRADERFVSGFVDPDRYSFTFDRDASDYVYRTQDLIHLRGRKYHRKKNHLNRFLKETPFDYRSMDMDMVECFLNMQESWCELRKCSESPDLLSEDYAVYQALTNFDQLDYIGAGIQIGNQIEAFALGELLNPSTAVIHIEKANPEIPGLYAAINQMFCEKAWSDVTYINREQDMGKESLRKAKESYYPHHMVRKYTIQPT